MFARITLFEVDTLRISLNDAQRRFEELIVPRMRQQPGYQGAYLLRTPEGKGLLLTLWDTEAAAEAGVQSGYYGEQIGQFIAFFRSPPGREHYEVVFSEDRSKVGI